MLGIVGDLFKFDESVELNLHFIYTVTRKLGLDQFQVFLGEFLDIWLVLDMADVSDVLSTQMHFKCV